MYFAGFPYQALNTTFLEVNIPVSQQSNISGTRLIICLMILFVIAVAIYLYSWWSLTSTSKTPNIL
jgi:hypothetical protein